MDLVIQAASNSDTNKATVRNRIEAIAERSFISKNSIQAIISQGWRDAVTDALAKGVPSREQDNRLRKLFKDWKLDSVPNLSLVDMPKLGEAMRQLDEAARKRKAEDYQQKYKTMENNLRSKVRRAAQLTNDSLDIASDTLEIGYVHTMNEMDAALQTSGLTPKDKQLVLISAYELAVEDALKDGVLTEGEFLALAGYVDHFDLVTDALCSNSSHRKLIKALTLKDLAEGLIPQRYTASDLPINLQKSEQLIWVFIDVDYWEQQSKSEVRGTSHGFDMRLGRSLDYEPRQFSSQTHEWNEIVHVDRGLLAVTDKYIYFHGTHKRFRIHFDNIVSFDKDVDGLGLIRDTENAKMQWFYMEDGSFAYTLVTKLTKL